MLPMKLSINQVIIRYIMECWAHHARQCRSHSQVISKRTDCCLRYKVGALSLTVHPTPNSMIRRVLPNGRIPHGMHILLFAICSSPYILPRATRYRPIPPTFDTSLTIRTRTLGLD